MPHLLEWKDPPGRRRSQRPADPDGPDDPDGAIVHGNAHPGALPRSEWGRDGEVHSGEATASGGSTGRYALCSSPSDTTNGGDRTDGQQASHEGRREEVREGRVQATPSGHDGARRRAREDARCARRAKGSERQEGTTAPLPRGGAAGQGEEGLEALSSGSGQCGYKAVWEKGSVWITAAGDEGQRPLAAVLLNLPIQAVGGSDRPQSTATRRTAAGSRTAARLRVNARTGRVGRRKNRKTGPRLVRPPLTRKRRSR